VCNYTHVDSRQVIKRLKKDGWQHIRTNGDHQIFKKDGADHLISITHPRKDLSPGLLRDVERKAGWK